MKAWLGSEEQSPAGFIAGVSQQGSDRCGFSSRSWFLSGIFPPETDTERQI